MKIDILAIGQARGAPEAALVENYCSRTRHLGKTIGLTDIAISEFREKKGLERRARQQAEHGILLDALQNNSGPVVALDETGTSVTSRQFADSLQNRLDSGIPYMRFVIGGADGLTHDMRRRADFVLSLGTMTWPHLLARVLLAEQIWRGVSICANHPYHRDGL